SATFLAHQAWLMTDAIVRTAVRLLITRRHLLEWVSADRLAGVERTLADVWRSMWAAPAIAAATIAVVAAIAPLRLPLALPMIALWALSPLVAHRSGKPIAQRLETISDENRIALRKVARQTWRYFEDLGGPLDHWLIPDNSQEDRDEVLAHRTSPTNIGLQLIATLSAYDFGYLSALAVIERLEPTFATLLQLARYRGHFYN